MDATPQTVKMLEDAADVARRFDSPTDYFRGLRWQKSFVPDNILCFHREHQVHELSGWEGISEKSGKYDQHGRFVLLVCLEGGGSIGVEKNAHQLAQGDSLLIFPHQLHYYLKIPKEFCWLYVTFELPREATEPIELLRDIPRPMNQDCILLLREFMGAYYRSGSTWELGIALILRNLLLKLVQQSPHPPQDEPDGSMIVKNAKTFIYNHLDVNFSIADIAREVGFSESYLRARFKDETGISLWQFILAAKVSHAANLLRSTSSKIGEISKACGFDSQLSFARAFKRAFGYSPRQYRQKLNQSS
jgi:AraC-like DNA-binding protein/quercetin dioxygenase-like cupin family protein